MSPAELLPRYLKPKVGAYARKTQPVEEVVEQVLVISFSDNVIYSSHSENPLTQMFAMAVTNKMMPRQKCCTW